MASRTLDRERMRRARYWAVPSITSYLIRTDRRGEYYVSRWSRDGRAVRRCARFTCSEDIIAAGGFEVWPDFLYDQELKVAPGL
jgi:hypothetical protein